MINPRERLLYFFSANIVAPFARLTGKARIELGTDGHRNRVTIDSKIRIIQPANFISLHGSTPIACVVQNT